MLLPLGVLTIVFSIMLGSIASACTPRLFGLADDYIEMARDAERTGDYYTALDLYRKAGAVSLTLDNKVFRQCALMTSNEGIELTKVRLTYVQMHGWTERSLKKARELALSEATDKKLQKAYPDAICP